MAAVMIRFLFPAPNPNPNTASPGDYRNAPRLPGCSAASRSLPPQSAQKEKYRKIRERSVRVHTWRFTSDYH